MEMTSKTYPLMINTEEFAQAMKRVKDVINGKSPARVDSLPKDVDHVVINGTTVIVYLRDGNKGKSNCDYMDAFDPYVGFVLAYYKAKNAKNFELKRVLKSCIDSAQRKGYKQAILKNYNNVKKEVNVVLTSDDIRKLQRCLNALGYGGLTVNGEWNKATKKALMRFQQASGIKATGQLDDDTKRKFKTQGYSQGGLVNLSGNTFV